MTDVGQKTAFGAIGLVRFFLGFPQRLFDALALADILHSTEHPPGAILDIGQQHPLIFQVDIAAIRAAKTVFDLVFAEFAARLPQSLQCLGTIIGMDALCPAVDVQFREFLKTVAGNLRDRASPVDPAAGEIVVIDDVAGLLGNDTIAGFASLQRLVGLHPTRTFLLEIPVALANFIRNRLSGDGEGGGQLADFVAAGGIQWDEYPLLAHLADGDQQLPQRHGDLPVQQHRQHRQHQRQRGKTSPQHPLRGFERLASNQTARQGGRKIPARPLQAADGVILVGIRVVAVIR